MQIVVAHSDPRARRELRLPLERSGYQVEEAASAEEALSACRVGAPEVVLIEHSLARVNGRSLLDDLKSDPHAYTIGVVVVADDDLPVADAEDSLRRGALDLLIEPVIPAELVARVRAAARTKILQDELVGQSRRLETMLHEDPLTGLFNRRYVLTRLAGLISGARRHGRPLSVAMIDIDHFKSLNDAYGHDAGDAALVATTMALRDRLRAEDELGRLGGEEFLALLPDAAASSVGVVAESLQRERRGGADADGRPRAGRHGQHRMGGLGRRGGRRRARQTGRYRALRRQELGSQRRPGGREPLC